MIRGRRFGDSLFFLRKAEGRGQKVEGKKGRGGKGSKGTREQASELKTFWLNR
jgi:hypothetical protein